MDEAVSGSQKFAIKITHEHFKVGIKPFYTILKQIFFKTPLCSVCLCVYVCVCVYMCMCVFVCVG